MLDNIITVYFAIAFGVGVTLYGAITPLLRSRPRRAAAIAATSATLWPAFPVVMLAMYVPAGRDTVSRIVLGPVGERAAVTIHRGVR